MAAICWRKCVTRDIFKKIYEFRLFIVVHSYISVQHQSHFPRKMAVDKNTNTSVNTKLTTCINYTINPLNDQMYVIQWLNMLARLITDNVITLIR